MGCDCFFCGNGRFSVNRKIGLDGRDWIIYEDKNVFITPDISPIINGHFLIVSKKHINSFGNGSEDVFLSLQKAKRILKEDVYDKRRILFFEHGAVISHTAGSCIDHAHVHAIPLEKDIDVDAYLKKHKLLDTPKIKMTYENIHKFAEERKPYISYEYNEEDSWVREANWLPTQFFRILVSSYYATEYNWKITCRTESSKKRFLETLQMAAILSR
ncbi:MAG: HIT domain-containing protein [Lachnospiraceae bacterium]|nr:HIT domain-containing protein [Lachnospiraceae bacterium]